MEMRIYYLLAHSHVLHSASDDCQDGPTGAGCYQLANDGAGVEARQGWDQVREDLSTDDAAYRSGDHVSGAKIVVLEQIAGRISGYGAGNELNYEIDDVRHVSGDRAERRMATMMV